MTDFYDIFNRARHADLADSDLRLVVLDPTSIEGPIPDDSVRSGGLAYHVKAWAPGAWYPQAAPNLTLTLTEFPEPSGEAVYFKIPDPNAQQVGDDRLMQLERP